MNNLPVNSSGMIDRVLRAVRLDPDFYQEAEADTGLNQEALMVVIIAAVLSGIGAFLQGLISFRFGAAFTGLIFGAIFAVIGYYIWAYVTHFVGTRFFDGTADVGELLRTLGYASAPNALSFFVFIPCIGWIPALVGSLWALAAGIVAVREALDVTTGKAILTALIGWLLIMIVAALLSAIFGIGMGWTSGVT